MAESAGHGSSARPQSRGSETAACHGVCQIAGQHLHALAVIQYKAFVSRGALVKSWTDYQYICGAKAGMNPFSLYVGLGSAVPVTDV